MPLEIKNVPLRISKVPFSYFQRPALFLAWGKLCRGIIWMGTWRTLHPLWISHTLGAISVHGSVSPGEPQTQALLCWKLIRLGHWVIFLEYWPFKKNICNTKPIVLQYWNFTRYIFDVKQIFVLRCIFIGNISDMSLFLQYWCFIGIILV